MHASTNSLRVAHPPLRRLAPLFPRLPFAPFATIVVPCIILSVIALALASSDARTLALPTLVTANTAVLFAVVLWKRDRQLPVFEVGTLCVVATMLYGTMPFVGFLAAGLQWDMQLGDARLVVYEFDVATLARYAWGYAAYLATFAIVYLLVRGRHAVRERSMRTRSDRRSFIAVSVLLAAGIAFKWWMAGAYGLNLEVPYTELQEALSRIASIPYWLFQISTNTAAATLLLKMALLVLLMRRWNAPRWRYATIAWLGAEVVLMTTRMGGRANVVLLIVSAVLLYHASVRPLRAAVVAVAAAVVLAGFLTLGFVRSVGSQSVEGGWKRVFTAGNEFQALFATAFDIGQRKAAGTLGDVPWQVYVTDAYLLIPSQLLPFAKIDPAEWYLGVLGLRGTGVGFMFGVMAQAVLGFGLLELIVRAAVLAVVFALFHRWYVRHHSSFWPTLLYLFVGIMSYYTVRATTFWFLHFLAYQFLPVFLAAKLLELALARGVRSPETMHAT